MLLQLWNLGWQLIDIVSLRLLLNFLVNID